MLIDELKEMYCIYRGAPFIRLPKNGFIQIYAHYPLGSDQSKCKNNLSKIMTDPTETSQTLLISNASLYLFTDL